MTTLTQTTQRTIHKTHINKAVRRLSISGLRALWRSRRDLAALTPAQLDDIGVSPRAAATEAARTAWDVPAHWRD